MAWATAERGITRYRTCISQDNTPSLSLIRKLGFVQVSTQHQERRSDLVSGSALPALHQ
jgi:L-amino acid N-acyltransferase YncA